MISHTCRNRFRLVAVAATIGCSIIAAETSQIQRIYFPAAGCAGNVPSSGYDLSAIPNAPTAKCYGTSYRFGALDFAGGATPQSANFHIKLPEDWTAKGSAEATIHWFTPSPEGNTARWQLSTACINDGTTDVLSPSFKPAPAQTYKSGINLRTSTPPISLATSECLTGSALVIEITGSSNDKSATLSLVGIEVTLRR
jgi:hypothetical protein